MRISDWSSDVCSSDLPKAFKRHPVEALREHVYVAPYYEDDLFRLRDLIGIDRILFNSDYPHPEGLGRPLDFLDEIKAFSAADQEKIMCDRTSTRLNSGH